MTQKIKNYAKALLISSLSIVAISCSKDKSVPASEPLAVVNAKSQVNSTNDIPSSLTDDFYATGRYKIVRRADYRNLGNARYYPSETIPLLRPGQSLVSNGGQYSLDFQASDGNLVLTNRALKTVLWSIKQTGGTYLMFHKDGNLIMHTASGYNWVSDIYVAGKDYQKTGQVYLLLQDDGNLVMEWDGGNYTDVVGSTGTGAINGSGGGINSSHYGSLKF